jgi:hypothetical protein
MIPDFVLQMQEIEQNLQSQCEATKNQWQDSVAKRFYNNFIEEYSEKTKSYLFGAINMRGMGLDDLLKYIDCKQNEMKELSGVDAPAKEYSIGRVHDSLRERNPWDTNIFPHTQPGEMDAEDRHEILNKRDDAY